MFYRVGLWVLGCFSLSLCVPAGAHAAPDTDASLVALTRDLELQVTENGPDQPWTLHLSNLGETPIGLVADPGLLWFDVVVPGSATPQTCRLPEPLWPKTMRQRAQMVLPPGERFSRRFDPRFFCFSDLVQTVLLPGARVTPHFGWPNETRVVTVQGKRTEQTAPPAPPFLAWPLPNDEPPVEGGDASEPSDAEPEEAPSDVPAHEPWKLPREGLKHIDGATIVLTPAYAKWSAPAPRVSDGLHSAMLAGADAEDERNATVTVGVVNATAHSQQLVLRRELISYAVAGPDGTFQCETGDLGPPDITSFSTLASHGAERVVVRLIEMCPRGSFSRPGLYEVRATVHSRSSGQAFGLDAFVGALVAPRPALIRVRGGDQSSFLRAAPMVAGVSGVGGPPRPEGEAPDGAQEVPAPEEAPGDHDGAVTPEGTPPPAEPPADNTSVE